MMTNTSCDEEITNILLLCYHQVQGFLVRMHRIRWRFLQSERDSIVQRTLHLYTLFIMYLIQVCAVVCVFYERLAFYIHNCMYHSNWGSQGTGQIKWSKVKELYVKCILSNASFRINGAFFVCDCVLRGRLNHNTRAMSVHMEIEFKHWTRVNAPNCSTIVLIALRVETINESEKLWALHSFSFYFTLVNE